MMNFCYQCSNVLKTQTEYLCLRKIEVNTNLVTGSIYKKFKLNELLDCNEERAEISAKSNRCGVAGIYFVSIKYQMPCEVVLIEEEHKDEKC